MIKYVNINGYSNRGEIYPFSHYYQFIQNNADTPIIILVHAYECNAEVFKGYLFNNNKTFKSIPMTEDEIKEIEWVTGKLTQVEFDEVIKGSDFETAYNDFCKITE